LVYIGVLGCPIVNRCLYVNMFSPLSQGAGKPKQPMALGPNGHLAASVGFCSRRILESLFILSKQSDRLWTLDAERT